MKHYNLTVFVVVALVFSGMSYAENLSTEITVERTVEAELPQASSLPSVYPSVQILPMSTYKPQPTQYDRTVDFAPSAGNADMQLNTSPFKLDSKRGYLWAGYFPTYNLGVAAGYRLIDNNTTSLGLAARFVGMSYKNKKLANESRINSNTMGVKADFSHHFNKEYSLSAEVSYSFSGLKSPTRRGEDLSQSINAANAALKITHAGSLPAHLTVNYGYFGLGKDVPTENAGAMITLPAASDNRLLVAADVALPLTKTNTSFLDLDVYTDFLNAKGVRWQSPAEYVRPDNSFSGIVGIVPGVRFTHSQLDVKFGAKINIGVNSPVGALHVAPNVAVTWRPSGYLSVYGIFGGGEHFRTLAEQYQLSAFAPSVTASNRSYTPIDGHVGFNLRLVKNLYTGVYVGYAATERMPMLALLDDDIPVFMPVNLSGWNFGFDAKYEYGKCLVLDASLRLYPHNYKSGHVDAPDRAKVVMKIGAIAYLTDMLSVNVDYNLRASRSYYVLRLDGSRTAENMHNISNLSLGGHYAVTDKLSTFLRLENILCRRALVMPSIEQQSIHGLVGLQYRF